jgi:hypothetical protein
MCVLLAATIRRGRRVSQGLILDCSVNVQLSEGRIGFIGAHGSDDFLLYDPMAAVDPQYGTCPDCWESRLPFRRSARAFR